MAGSVPRLKSRLNLFVFLFAFIAYYVLLFTSSSYAFSFAVLGDNHGESEIFTKILTSIKNDKSIKFIINTGDFVVYGKDQEYRDYIALMKKQGIPVYNAPGNHDMVKGGWRRFSKYFGRSYYSFNYENCHFILLDNAFKGSFNLTQYNWLIKELKENQDKLLFVGFHKPVFDPADFFPDNVMSERAMAEKLQSDFTRYHVKYVFSGHLHGYGRAERGNVVYIVNSGAGPKLHLPYYLGGFNHYIKMTVAGDRITDQVVKFEEKQEGLLGPVK